MFLLLCLEVYCTVFIPIATQASISVIFISFLMIIVGALMLAVGVGFVIAVKCEKASTSKLQYWSILLTVKAQNEFRHSKTSTFL